MAGYEDVLNGVVDDDIENLFGDSSKSIAKMVEQGAKSAIKETRENPFNTANGQIVMSQGEHFWGRISRLGLRTTGNRVGTAVTTSPINFTLHNAVANKIILPEDVRFSATVDVIVEVLITTGIGTENYAIDGALVKAGEIFERQYNGSVKLYNGTPTNGTFTLKATATGTSGLVYIYSNAWSVDDGSI